MFADKDAVRYIQSGSKRDEKKCMLRMDRPDGYKWSCSFFYRYQAGELLFERKIFITLNSGHLHFFWEEDASLPSLNYTTTQLNICTLLALNLILCNVTSP
ncbi:hypothetical protein PAHAL_5G436800 [Panicum hallii]|uniref:Uncharacterized protein n=1 Tax=Panicum hallii TaxID=206008 RepID=A0A2T8IN56_9POAL|nr:hypothetical protein PAHAL_5G436800 [Panicum hallii]